jgi:hypothetical protein
MCVMTPEEVLDEYADRGVQLNIKHLDDDTVLIEADRESLEFLSRVFQAQARSADCGFHVGPSGAGSALFPDGATLGLYVHRVPCEHSEG